MIRTINERLRTNKKIVVEREKSGLSNILFALRSEKGADGKSAFEKHMGRKPNTLKSAMIEKCILDKDPRIDIEPEDFSEEADSTILVRERVRGTKLEGAFKKVKGNIVEESQSTLKILPKTGKSFILSKRDVAKTPDKEKAPQKKKGPKQEKRPKTRKTPTYEFLPNLEEVPNEENRPSCSWQQEMGQATSKGAEKEPPTKICKEENINTEEQRNEEVESNEPKEEEQSEPQTETTSTAPIQGEIKWEMSQARKSKRNKKKPSWLGQNVMVTKIEATSSQDEESLPSVYEIHKS